MPDPNQKMIFLIAGEPSGDSRGAELVRALKQQNPALVFVGLGGPLMAAAGVRLLYNLSSLAAIGFGDVLRKYFQIRQVFYQALRHVLKEKPAAIILIDYPGFNLRFAKKINRRLPVFYYVSPQIWAWAGGRIRTIRRVVTRMLVLFDFEKILYEKAGVPVTWVGHPLADSLQHTKPREELVHEFRVGSSTKHIALLPGSRRTEVERILPVMLEAAKLITKQSEEPVSFLISESENVPKHLFDTLTKPYEPRLTLKRVNGRTHDILGIADAAIVTSGTATLETALSLVPFVIVYKTAWSTYWIGRQVIRIPYIGLANVLAGKKIIPEFIQQDANPSAIASAIQPLLHDRAVRASMLAELSEVKSKLGPAGASERAAAAILQELV